MKIYRDWKPERRIRRFAKRHGLNCVKFSPPHESPFLRVWFDLDNEEHRKLEYKTRKLYGVSRGGYTA